MPVQIVGRIFLWLSTSIWIIFGSLVSTNSSNERRGNRDPQLSGKVMSKLFGTDGIRGEAGSFPLDHDTVVKFGHSLALRLREKPGKAGDDVRVVIGRDTRESGEWIEESLIEGLVAGGASWCSAGVITTPGVAYLTRIQNADAGVVISASHNPYQDNGLKVFTASGQKLDAATESLIEKDIADSEVLPLLKTPQTDCSASSESLRNSYLAYLRDEIAAGLDLKGWKLVLDCANGAAYELAPKLFEALGASVISIHISPDGRNINRDCGALHTETLQQKVIETGSDIGIAFDGDADRSLFVDAAGNLVDGDQILFITANYLANHKELKANRVVATVMSNLGLELALRARGIELIRTNVGDKYVLDELLTNGGSIGGEQSGHVIFPEISLAGDGMITSIELLKSIVESGHSLQEMASGFVRYPQVVVNVRVGRKPPLDSVPEISQAIAKLDQELAGDGRLLVRYSGTENLARIMIEGKELATISKAAHDLSEVLSSSLSD